MSSTRAEEIDFDGPLIPLVTFSEEEIIYNEDVARKTFANQKYCNKKITLVSVMGPSRSGKSFLMSILKMDGPNKQIRGAFQSGYDRHTEGILIFREPSKLADDHFIFFLDTQGTFDLQTDRNTSAWIAGFSLLVSDIQIINLRGNIGGDDLMDLHTFLETSALFPGGKLAKDLIFVIRDAPDSNILEQPEFLENLWQQCEKSKDLREVSLTLKKRFENRMHAFCTPSPSLKLRKASEIYEIGEDYEDLKLLDSFSHIKTLVIRKSLETFQITNDELISLHQRIGEFLQKEAPRLQTSTKVIQAASIVVSVNRSMEIFKTALKNCTINDLEKQEIIGRSEAEKRLKEMLMPKDYEEGKKGLDLKIKEYIAQKREELQKLEAEKMGLKNLEAFITRWRSKIQKITRLEDLMEIKNSDLINLEADKELGVLYKEKAMASLKITFDSKLQSLRLSTFRQRLDRLSMDFRKDLLQRKFTKVPSEDDFNSEIENLIKNEKNQFLHLFNQIEQHQLENQIRQDLEKIALDCRKLITQKVEAQQQMTVMIKENLPPVNQGVRNPRSVKSKARDQVRAKPRSSSASGSSVTKKPINEPQRSTDDLLIDLIRNFKRTDYSPEKTKLGDVPPKILKSGEKCLPAHKMDPQIMAILRDSGPNHMFNHKEKVDIKKEVKQAEKSSNRRPIPKMLDDLASLENLFNTNLPSSQPMSPGHSRFELNSGNQANTSTKIADQGDTFVNLFDTSSTDRHPSLPIDQDRSKENNSLPGGKETTFPADAARECYDNANLVPRLTDYALEIEKDPCNYRKPEETPSTSLGLNSGPIDATDPWEGQYRHIYPNIGSDGPSTSEHHHIDNHHTERGRESGQWIEERLMSIVRNKRKTFEMIVKATMHPNNLGHSKLQYKEHADDLKRELIAEGYQINPEMPSQLLTEAANFFQNDCNAILIELTNWSLFDEEIEINESPDQLRRELLVTRRIHTEINTWDFSNSQSFFTSYACIDLRKTEQKFKAILGKKFVKTSILQDYFFQQYILETQRLTNFFYYALYQYDCDGKLCSVLGKAGYEYWTNLLETLGRTNQLGAEKIIDYYERMTNQLHSYSVAEWAKKQFIARIRHKFPLR